MKLSHCLAGLLFCLMAAITDAADVKGVDINDATASSRAVIVGKTALAHTAQLLPVNDKGEIVGKGDASVQTEQVLKNLETALAEVKSTLSGVVKLNVYAVDAKTAAVVQSALAKKFFHAEVPPAVTFVTGKLTHPDALVAMDAVATSELAVDETKRIVSSKLHATKGASHVAVLPTGSKVYVSGQAEKGTLLESTHKTLESLSKTLAHLNLNDSHIVQVKSFLTPMASVTEVEQEILKYFGDKGAPPLVFVEWTSTVPIEIEVIAAGGEPKSTEPIEFITPPDMKASPVYCRVARINRDPTIFMGGLYGSSTQNGKAEVMEILDALKSLADKCGTDMKHLAKATYYVSANDASNELNAQRPNYYDPERPPAASKALVPGVGLEGKTITMDMIAVGK